MLMMIKTYDERSTDIDDLHERIEVFDPSEGVQQLSIPLADVRGFIKALEAAAEPSTHYNRRMYVTRERSERPALKPMENLNA